MQTANGPCKDKTGCGWLWTCCLRLRSVPIQTVNRPRKNKTSREWLWTEHIRLRSVSIQTVNRPQKNNTGHERLWTYCRRLRYTNGEQNRPRKKIKTGRDWLWTKCIASRWGLYQYKWWTGHARIRQAMVNRPRKNMTGHEGLWTEPIASGWALYLYKRWTGHARIRQAPAGQGCIGEAICIYTNGKQATNTVSLLITSSLTMYDVCGLAVQCILQTHCEVLVWIMDRFLLYWLLYSRMPTEERKLWFSACCFPQQRSKHKLPETNVRLFRKVRG